MPRQTVLFIWLSTSPRAGTDASTRRAGEIGFTEIRSHYGSGQHLASALRGWLHDPMPMVYAMPEWRRQGSRCSPPFGNYNNLAARIRILEKFVRSPAGSEHATLSQPSLMSLRRGVWVVCSPLRLAPSQPSRRSALCHPLMSSRPTSLSALAAYGQLLMRCATSRREADE